MEEKDKGMKEILKARQLFKEKKKHKYVELCNKVLVLAFSENYKNDKEEMIKSKNLNNLNEFLYCSNCNHKNRLI